MLRLNFSKKKNEVPVLSRIQMDRMAELVHLRFHVRINLFRLAQEFTRILDQIAAVVGNVPHVVDNLAECFLVANGGFQDDKFTLRVAQYKRILFYRRHIDAGMCHPANLLCTHRTVESEKHNRVACLDGTT